MQFLSKVVPPHICKMHNLVKLPLLLQQTGSALVSDLVICNYMCRKEYGVIRNTECPY